jgi:hypothetical protein
MMQDVKHIVPLRLVLPLLSAYLIISAFGLYNHELWLDEAQHFLIGRDSDSLGALYYNMRYDGHPRLWNALLYMVTHYVTTSYAGLQVLHLLISTSAVFVFLRYAPFSLLLKMIIISGYYFLFEYNLLSRSYALGLLSLFIACTLLRDPVRNQVSIGAMLALLCNTHLFFAFAAIGIFLCLLPECTRGKNWRRAGFILFTTLFLAGLLSAIIQTRTPAEDNCYAVRPGEWFTFKNLFFAATGLVKGWLPIPRIPAERFWNTFWIDTVAAPIRLILFVFFLLFPALAIRKDGRALVFYYTSLSLLLAFLVVTQISASRLFGMVYIFFLAACWLAGYRSKNVFSMESISGRARIRTFFRVSLYSILSIQVVIGIYALEQNFTRPFSESRNTVDYIQTHGLSDQAIVVDGYNAGPVLSAYLGKKVFYLDIGREGSYCTWKRSYFPIPRKSIEQEMAQSAFLQGLDKFILVSNRQMDVTKPRDSLFQFTPLDKFQRGIILSENYFIYQAMRNYQCIVYE